MRSWAITEVMNTFENFQLLPTLQATLLEKKFEQPTEIQARAIPRLLAGESLVGVSETGSGKTLTYALPVLHLIKTLEIEKQAIQVESQPRALVLVPTRELGEQVAKVFKPFTHTTRLRVRTVLGGTAFDVSRRNALGAFEVLIATPGRLVQLLDKNLVSLSDIRILVFDEADQILDEGFLPVAKRIVADCPKAAQLVLFSATVTSAVQTLIKELFAKAEVIRSQGSHRVVPTLKTLNYTISDGKRFPELEKLLDKKTKGGTVVFVNTREQCDRLVTALKKAERPCLVYRGEMDKVERRKNLQTFRDGVIDVLVSTDLASRGLDVEHISRVINYHMPQQMEAYLHRVGRTARAGRQGVVINFITERDQTILRSLSKVQSEP
jgi:superfamily II DNA/RNA helicase